MSSKLDSPISQINPNEEGVGSEFQYASSSPNPFDPEKLTLRGKRALVPDTEAKAWQLRKAEATQ